MVYGNLLKDWQSPSSTPQLLCTKLYIAVSGAPNNFRGRRSCSRDRVQCKNYLDLEQPQTNQSDIRLQWPTQRRTRLLYKVRAAPQLGMFPVPLLDEFVLLHWS